MAVLALTKRQKIVICSCLATVGFLLTQLSNFFFIRLYVVLGFVGVVFLLSLWALSENLSKTKLITLFILPVLYALGVTAFYFLFPLRWVTRIPMTLFFGFSIYLLLLAQNVFSIASTKAIPLYRAASTVSLVFTIFAIFLLTRVWYSLELPFYWNGLAVSIVGFLLALQSFWSVDMERITFQIFAYSLSVGIILGECALVLSFWPMSSAALNMTSILLSAVAYILLGISTDLFRDRLNGRVVAEYLTVGLIVLLATFFTSTWTG